MSYILYIEKINKTLESLQKRLSDVQEDLYHELSDIEEHQYEACKLEEQEKRLLEEIKELEEELKKEEQKVRCPECFREFTLDEINDLLQEDEYGQYWKCPNKICSFKGYHEKGNFFFEFKELIKRKQAKEREFLEKNFKKINLWV